MPEQLTPIAETNRYIVLDKYVRRWEPSGSYQSEDDLERELIEDLQEQGYEYRADIRSRDTMLANVRIQLEALNDVAFSDSEWKRFVTTYLDRPSESVTDKARKLHDDHIFDFVFDDGRIQNIYLVDKTKVCRNTVQVIRQFEQTGTFANRYDVTILVNGLPLVQVELKKRGVAIREAFNQIHRYSKESFNSDNSLYKFIQMFVISNGTDTRYFANTTKRDKNSFDFTMNWATENNQPLKDLRDFTATFFERRTLLKILLDFSVFDASDTLLIMRPYQIAATERILRKIESSFEAGTLNKPESGGYIWHTTGSGKTLTSFKAARLATELNYIDRVFFVVDRKDLDYQTMKEYQRFSPDSVNGSASTAGLKRNLSRSDNKIIVTTIQKLNNLMKAEADLPVYQEACVFIFDECHRSQFGEAQKNLKKRFKRFCQFGFTGTPIFPDNATGAETTAGVFGHKLHDYVITDAIRDDKVLKFKVDYNNVTPRFKAIETEQDEEKLSASENKRALLHPDRIEEVSRYILNNYRRKTHRLYGDGRGFNAMFAVSSIDAAKLYYDALNALQAGSEKPLKIATIFSYAANEEQKAKGAIEDETFDPSALDQSAKEFLAKAIDDYNVLFRTSFSVESKSFQNYYRDLAKRVKSKEVDLLIVVGMFLTGFDAPTLNTLFVDKTLRYHGLIQAFSRTNRIYDSTKSFGNIVTFRDLEDATVQAISLFGNSDVRDVVLEKSYEEYIDGFADPLTGDARRGFAEVVAELNTRFPNPTSIIRESDKKAFTKLFGEYLRIENILQNYDEFSNLKALQEIDLADANALQSLKEECQLTGEDVEELLRIDMPSERELQDYRSTYNDIRDWLRRERANAEKDDLTMDWEDIVFEIDLIKSQEINLDYILGLIFENSRMAKDKGNLVDDIRRMIRASLGARTKEDLIVDFLNRTDLDVLAERTDVIDAFYQYARLEQKREARSLIESEQLNEDSALRYLKTSLQRGFASDKGTELSGILPKMSPLNPQHLTKKREVFEKVSRFVEKFNNIGGDI